MWCTVHVDPI